MRLAFANEKSIWVAAGAKFLEDHRLQGVDRGCLKIIFSEGFDKPFGRGQPKAYGEVDQKTLHTNEADVSGLKDRYAWYMKHEEEAGFLVNAAPVDDDHHHKTVRENIADKTETKLTGDLQKMEEVVLDLYEHLQERAEAIGAERDATGWVDAVEETDGNIPIVKHTRDQTARPRC